MLFEITHGCYPIDPVKLKQNPLYLAFVAKHLAVTVNAAFKRLNQFIDSQAPSQRSQLIWFRLSKMMGRQSATPHKDIVYIEEIVEGAVGGGKPFLQLCGLLLKIAVAERPEDYWVCSKVITDEIDEDTGRFIAWTGYWFDPHFKVPAQYKKHSISDLQKKFVH